ncbi:MAG: glycosyltransferase family 2 protein [Armatimonadetes bacterium]|nr:glycosyltransferase family 2 protein [Armatimonadota bacterium]NOG38480.1 glycosyltransferase family 2 protein [Armatimonadota bacterium]GIK32095.1 MAG: glycosyl transferase [Armatimonadota bacterium]
MWDFELSVTICSWNTAEDLRKCLQSLEDVRAETSFEAIVVDNASEDGSPEMVEREFPWVRLMRQSVNLGFAGGHNLAIRNRKGKHVFLLNSDAYVHAGALRTLAEYVEAHPGVGIVGPKILNPDGSLQYSCRRLPNPVAAMFRNTPLGKLFPHNRFTREYLMTDWEHDAPRAVDWVSGAAMLASEAMIESVGVMDEGYFMYCEDVDWCWRARENGWEIVYLPTSVVTHAIGRSTDRIANQMIVRFHRSMLRFYRLRMLPRVFLLWRPFLYLCAAGALALRASIFLGKNLYDALMRKLRK